MKPKKHTSHVKTLPGVEPPSNINEEFTRNLWRQADEQAGGEADKLRLPRPHHITTSQYLQGILSGNRTLLAKAITLVESSRSDHREQAQEIIGECLRHSKDEVLSGFRHRFHCEEQSDEAAASGIRIGITGIPGVGKSTFIEALGKHLTARGHRVAVLAVDPSSTLSKGSILGDKTRMESLAVDPNAFIRPSPSAGTLGGVARKTRETILLCEAAGFDVIIVETVGVGQSETTVKSMVDFFLLLMIAGAGDELQGIKRGIIEMADAVIINKADGENLVRARMAARDYANALHLFPPAQMGWTPVVDICSSLTGEGIPRVWEIVEDFFSTMTQYGHFQKNRIAQNRHVFRQAIEEQLREQFFNDPAIRKKIQDLEKQVSEGTINPYQAAASLMKR